MGAINLISRTWWLWFILIGVVSFLIALWPTANSLFTGRWNSWRFIIALAITCLGFLTLASGVTYLWAMPIESLIIEFPKPTPPPPGQFPQIITFEGLYIGFVNITAMTLKSWLGWFFAAFFGLMALRVIADAVPVKKKGRKRL